jgi:hypothetical protein
VAKIFVSYSRKRPSTAQRIAKRLEEVGYDVFIDSKIVAGEDYEKRILSELEGAHAVIAVWDNDTVDSQPVLDECRRANKLQKLIPVLIEEVSINKLPFQLSSIQYIEMFEEDDLEGGDTFDALMRGIVRLCDPERFRDDLRKQDSSTELKPIKPDSTDSVSVQLSAILDDLANNLVRVPAYQREDNQWDLETKSLFVESIINNLPVPAFFFEPVTVDGFAINYVVDGQQRLSVLHSYFRDEFALIDSAATPYISEQADHYRGRRFSELHPVFQSAFKKYQLTIMKVRDLGDQRLEIFRRINRGGTPLSAQDIRLAYYSASSSTINYIRLVGVADPSKPSSKRAIDYIDREFKLVVPWQSQKARSNWQAFWAQGSASLGQRASEMFLWTLIAADIDRARKFLPDDRKSATLDRGQKGLDYVLDKYSEKLAARDLGASDEVMTLSEISGGLFPLFEEMVAVIFDKNHIVPEHAAKIALTLGAMYRHGLRSGTSAKILGHIPEYVHSPNKLATKFKLGRITFSNKWLHSTGYLNFIEKTGLVLNRLSPKK